MYGRWEIDWDALRAACYTLGLEWPVTVRLVPTLEYEGFHQISYEDYPERYRHLISLRPFRGVLEINRTLWHELSHALDAERDVREVGLIKRHLNVMIEHELIDYDSRSGERRARRLESRALSHPLVLSK